MFCSTLIVLFIDAQFNKGPGCVWTYVYSYMVAVWRIHCTLLSYQLAPSLNQMASLKMVNMAIASLVYSGLVETVNFLFLCFHFLFSVS